MPKACVTTSRCTTATPTVAGLQHAAVPPPSRAMKVCPLVRATSCSVILLAVIAIEYPLGTSFLDSQLLMQLSAEGTSWASHQKELEWIQVALTGSEPPCVVSVCRVSNFVATILGFRPVSPSGRGGRADVGGGGGGVSMLKCIGSAAQASAVDARDLGVPMSNCLGAGEECLGHFGTGAAWPVLAKTSSPPP